MTFVLSSILIHSNTPSARLRTHQLQTFVRTVHSQSVHHQQCLQHQTSISKFPLLCVPAHHLPSRYTSSPIIRITVGTPPRRLRHNIYTSLLRDKSAFFRAKLATHNRNTSSASTQTIFISDNEDASDTDKETTINLPNIDPDAFQQYVQWLYSKPFDLSNLHLVVETYLLGHTLNDESFRNDLIDALRSHYTKHPLGKVDLQAMVKLSEALPPHLPENKGRNQLLELLVAQLSYKVLQRGLHNYQESPHFQRLLDSSIVVVMSYLKWNDRLQESIGGVCRGRKRVKRENEEESGGEDGGIAGGIYARKKRKVKFAEAGMVNPAAMRGCMFHEHKERGSVCRSPEDLVED